MVERRRVPIGVWIGAAFVTIVGWAFAWKSREAEKEKEASPTLPPTFENPPGPEIPIATPSEALRNRAIALLPSVVPNVQGDARFLQVALPTDWQVGFGTTCGHLAQWLLWRLGCRDERVMNRTAPSEGLHYVPGQNISKLVFGGKAAGAFRFAKGKEILALPPEPGDVLYFAAPGGGKEHVAIFTGFSLDPDGVRVWKTADGGQGTTTHQTMNFNRRRELRPGVLAFLSGEKEVLGVLDIARLSYGPEPERPVAAA